MFPIPWKVDILTLWLHKLLFFYLSITATALHRIFVYPFTKISWNWFPIFTPFLDKILSFYFIYFCNLSPCKVDLDDQTTVHFWAPGHREFDKPNLVLIHGYGANAKWQFVFQVGPLSQFFNLYVPDLLFFGESFTTNPDRTDVFQAKCVSDGMKRLGVERYSLSPLFIFFDLISFAYFYSFLIFKPAAGLMADYTSSKAEHVVNHEDTSSSKKYGGLVPKKKPLISKDHERAFFDSADWALHKQGAIGCEKSTVAVETLRPKLQRTPHQQLPPRRPACTSGN